MTYPPYSNVFLLAKVYTLLLLKATIEILKHKCYNHYNFKKFFGGHYGKLCDQLLFDGRLKRRTL